MKTLPQLLTELERLEKEATPGPWYVGHISEVKPPAADVDSAVGAICDKVYTYHDQAFIIECRKNLPTLLTAIHKMKEALEYVVAHEHSNLEMDPDIHRHDRYRENMYWKARTCLKELGLK